MTYMTTFQNQNILRESTFKAEPLVFHSVMINRPGVLAGAVLQTPL